MHTKKFVQHILDMATSPEAVEKISHEIASGLITNRLNHKDVQALVKHIKQHISTKPTFKAPKQSVLQDHESFEFVQSDEVGLQVQDGDLMYKRTLDRDLNKLLTS